jgi:hypothetical protein
VGLVIVIAIVVWCFMGYRVGQAIGTPKDRQQEGGNYGLFLGPIGWVIVGLMEPGPAARRREQEETAAAIEWALAAERDRSPARVCPWCAETIKAAAKVCRYCGRDLGPIDAARAEPAPGAQVESLSAILASADPGMKPGLALGVASAIDQFVAPVAVDGWRDDPVARSRIERQVERCLDVLPAGATPLLMQQVLAYVREHYSPTAGRS